ncbi:MAG: BNR-repeat neuraminidase N-terminal domain-containing protein [Bacteroidota bacterium]
MLVPLLFVLALFTGSQSYGQTYISQEFDTQFAPMADGVAGPGPRGDANTIPANSAGNWTQTRTGKLTVPELYSTGITGGARDFLRITAVPGGTYVCNDFEANGYINAAVRNTTSSPVAIPNSSSGSGTYAAWFNDYNANGTQSRQIETPAFNSVGGTGILRCGFYYVYGGSATACSLMVSTDNGTNWTFLSALGASTVAVSAFSQKYIAVPNSYRSAQMKLAIKITATYGSYDLFIDKFTVDEYTPGTFTAKAGNEGYNRWSAACAWVDGVVPTTNGLDNVVVPSGTTMILDAAASVNNLTVSGSLKASAGSAKTITVGGTLTVNSGGAFDLFPTTSTTTTNACSAASLSTAGTANQTYTLNNVVNAGTITVSAASTVTNNFNVNGNIDNTGGTFTLNLGSSTRLTLGGTAATTISGNGLILNTITVNNAAGVTANVPITTRSTTGTALTLTAGKLNMGSNLFWMDYAGTGSTYPASVSSGLTATSYIIGKVQYTLPATAAQSRTFPIGDATGSRNISVNTLATVAAGTTIAAEIVAKSTTPTFTTPVQVLFGTRAYKITSSVTNPFISTSTIAIGAGAEDVATMSGSNAELVIASSSAADGPYANYGSTATGTSPPSGTFTLTSSLTPAAITSGAYFAMATTSLPAFISAVTVDNTFSATVVPSATNQNILHFVVKTGAATRGTYTLTGVTLTGNNQVDADIANVKLWSTTGATYTSPTLLSTGTITFSGGTPVTGGFAGGTATITGLTKALATAAGATTDSHFWVTYDIAATTVGSTIGAQLGVGALTITAAGAATAAGTQPSSLLTPSANPTRTIVLPMSYSSESAALSAGLTNGANAASGSSANMLDMVVNMDNSNGHTGIVNATVFSFNLGSGTYATTTPGDITAANLYYSATPDFASPTLFGTKATPTGSYTITGTQALANGANYFRLVYTLSTSAANYNFLGAEFLGATVNGAAQAYSSTPSVYRTVYNAPAAVTENFETTIPNVGWSLGTSGGNYTNNWANATSSSAPTVSVDATNNTTSTKFARVAYNSSFVGTADLISPLFDVTNKGANPTNVTFWYFRESTTSYPLEHLEVWAATSPPVATAALTGSTKNTLLRVIMHAATLTTYPSGLPTTSAANNGVTPAFNNGTNSTYTGTETVGWHQYTVAIPATMNSGYIVFRVNTMVNGENHYIDEVSIPSYPQVAAFNPASFTPEQVIGDGTVSPNTNNSQILKIPVEMTGASVPMTVTAFNLSTAGSDRLKIGATDADITKARLYYTGTTSTFTGITQTDAVQFGSDVTSNNTTTGAFTITGSKQLQSGTNYFWLLYDIPALATSTDPGSAGSVLSNKVDAELTSIALNSDRFNNKVPTVTAPAGKRTVFIPMAVTSAAVSQLNGGTQVAPGATGVQTLKLTVNTAAGAAVSVSSVVFNTTSLTNVSALASARLYYTTANTFSSATQFGSAVTSFTSATDFTFTSVDGQNLTAGANYFWLVYDVKGSAVTYNTIDASLTKFVFGGTDFNAASTPAVTTPDPTGFIQVFTNTPAVTEPFDAAIPNSGWTRYGSSGSSYLWQNMAASSASAIHPTIVNDATGSTAGNAAFFNSYSYTSGSVADLVSPVLDMTNRGSNSAAYSFYMYRSSAYPTNRDQLQVWYSPTAPTSTTVTPSGATLLYVVNLSTTLTDIQSGLPATAAENNGYTPLVAGAESVGWHQYTGTLPAAFTGTGYVYFRGLSGFGDNIYLDEIFLPNYAPVMAFSSASTTPTNSDIALGLTNARMQQIKISVTGSRNPISLSSLTLSTSGTTGSADILKARVYSTGNSATFATTTQFGAETVQTAGAFPASFTASGPAALVAGDNYFWVVYDVTTAAGSNNHTVASTVTNYVLSSAPTTNATLTGGTASRTLKTPMTVVSSALSYPTADPVLKGSTGNVIALYDLQMSTGASLDLTAITFNTTGSDAPTTDVTTRTLVSTGSSATYNAGTATQFGTSFTSTPMAFTGTYALSAGHNYFWLLYDISASAVTGDIVAARQTVVKINGITPDPVSSTQTPTGTPRTVLQSYCSTALQTVPCSTSGNYIKSVSLAAPANSPSTVTTLSNTNSNCPAGSSGYSYYPVSVTTATLTAGVTYTISVTPSMAGQVIGVWLDADRNGTYAASEFTLVSTSTTANGTVTAPITVPSLASAGYTGIRVRVAAGISGTDACTSFAEGETEEYIVSVIAPAACPGTPVAGTITGTSDGCAGFAPVFTLSGQSTGYTGTTLTFQWQSSTTSGSGFTNVGTNSATYTAPSTLTGTTYYKVVATCSTGGTSAETPEFAYTVSAPVYAALPYTQSFETWATSCGTSSAPASWRNNTALTGDASWRRNDDLTAWTAATAGTGAYFPFASEGSKSARFHSTATSSASNFDLYVNLGTNAVIKRFSFDYNNADGADQLAVSISSTGSAPFTSLGTFTTAADWTTQSIQIPASFTGNAVVRFTATGQSNAANSTDIGLDNLLIEESNTCTGAPTAGTVTYTPPANPCLTTTAGRTYSLSLHDYSIADGISIQWRRSTNGGVTFSDLSGETSPILNALVPLGSSPSNAVTSYIFKAVVTCTASGQTDEISQTIVSSPPVSGTITAPAGACIGATVALTPAGFTAGLSYQWEVSATGSEGWTNATGTGATSATYTATVAGTIKYYRMTTTCGLKFSATNVVAVTPLAPTYATLPFIENFETTWSSRCATREIPNAAWSQTAPLAVSDPGASWRRDDDGASAAWPNNNGVYTPGGSVGSHSARFNSWNADAGSAASMFLYLTLPGTAVNRQLSFDYINTSGTDALVVSTSLDGGATWSDVGTYGVAAAWEAEAMGLTGITSTSLIIRFAATSDYGTTDIGIDNVVVAEACNGAQAGSVPASASYCGAAVQLIASSTASKPLSAGTGIVYQWQKRTSTTPVTWTDVTDGTGANTITYTTPAALTGTNLYRLKVTCTTGNATAFSDAVTVSPISVTPATVTSSVVYQMSFEDAWLTGCNTGDRPATNWSQSAPAFSTDPDASWRRDDDVTSAPWNNAFGNYTPTGSVGSRSARFHSYGVTPAGSASLLLHLNLTSGGAVNRLLTFDYINNGGTDTMKVYGSTDGGTNFTLLAKYGSITTWTTQTIALNGINAADYVLSFTATGLQFSSDIGLDNVTVSQECSGTITAGSVPASAYFCSASSAATFTASNTASQPLSVGLGITYQWQKLTSTSPDVWSDVTTGSGGTTLTYTTPTTGQVGGYRLKVMCSSGSVAYSSVVNVISAVSVTPASLPFTETFEQDWTSLCYSKEVPTSSWRQTAPNFATDADASWRRDDDGASAGWGSTTSGTYSPVSSQGSHSARFHTWLATEPNSASLDLYVDFTNAATRTLVFDWINPTGTDVLDLLVSTDGGTTFSNPSGGAVHLTTSGSWASKTVMLTGYNNPSVILRFKAVSDFGDDDIGLDNIRITQPNFCAGTPTAGTVASQTFCSGGTATFTAAGATDNTSASGISYQWSTSSTVDGTYTDITGATSVTYTTGVLTAPAFYKFKVTCLASSASSTSSAAALTMNPYYQCYCGPGAVAPNNTALHSTACASSNNISAVSISANSFSSTSACGSASGTAFTRYAPAGTLTTTLYKGSSYSFNVTTTRSGQYIGLWIDYNQNNSFEASEYVSVAAGNNIAGQVSTATVNVPSGAVSGITGVRVRSSNTVFTGSSACATFATGETEDYAFTLADLPACPAPDNFVSSAVTYNSATLTWAAGMNEIGGYDLQYRYSTNNTWINLPHQGTGVTTFTGTFNSGSCVLVRVRSYCLGGAGEWSAPITFCTSPAFDEPCGATAVTITNGAGCSYSAYTNASATSGSQGNVSCLSTPSNWSRDVWFTTTVPANGTIAIDVRSSLGMVVQLLTAANCNGTFSAVTTGTGSSCSNATVPYLYRSGMTPGTQVYIRVSRQGASNAGGDFTMCVTDGLYWIGASSSSWNTGSNWMGNTVPSSSATPSIPQITGTARFTPVITGSTQASSLLIKTGAQLAVNAPLSISGNVVNNGTVSGTGALIFSGTASQQLLTTVSPLALGDIIVSASAGTTVKQTGPVKITGSLNVNSGTYDMNSQSFTLVSTATATARIAAPANPIANANNVTVQRYIPAGNTAGSYNFLGTTLSGKTIASYMTAGIQTLGFPDATYPAENPSVWFFDPLQSGNAYQGWYAATGSANTVNPGSGVRLWVPGAFQRAVGAISLTGTITQGNLVKPLSYNAGSGFNLVANPYPSEIDWDLVSASDRSNVDAAVWIYRYNLRAYSSYVGGIGVNGGSRYLASSQGFFVNTSAASPSLTFKESIKTDVNPALLRTSPSDAQLLRIEMSAVRGGTPYSDEIVVRLHNSATKGFDRNLDARKMVNTNLNLSTIAEGNTRMAINAIPVPARSESIALVASAEAGTAKLSFSELESLPEGMQVYLKDNFLNSLTAVNSGSVYSFSITANPASAGEGRFEIVFMPAGVTGLQTKSGMASFSAFPNPTAGKDLHVSFSGFDKETVAVSITDVLGKEVFSTTLQGATNEMITKSLPVDLASGVYTITGSTDKMRMTQKLTVTR